MSSAINKSSHQLSIQQIVEDFSEFSALLADFLDSNYGNIWQKQTGTREKDWTLHQLLAHLEDIAGVFLRYARAASDDTHDGAQIALDGLSERRDLRAYNAAAIADGMQYSPAELTDRLIDSLDATVALLRTSSSEQLDQTAFLRFYNRPARAIDFIDFQLSHAGVVHAAQLTRPLKQPPLWNEYAEGLLHRQIDRFLRHLSFAYWQDLRPQETQTINFWVGGVSGGGWHMVAAPDGGRCEAGLVDKPDYMLRFTHPGALFSLFTMHTPFETAIRSQSLVINGNDKQTWQVMKYFAATLPKA